MKAPGTEILKVISILFIIFASLCLGFLILSFVLGFTVNNDTNGLSVSFCVYIGAVQIVVFPIHAAVKMIIGIIGVKKASDINAAMFFIVVGFANISLILIDIILSFNLSFNILKMLSLVMPVLLIVGGFMNKNAVRSGSPS